MILEKIKSQLKHAMKKSEKENVLAVRNILEKIKNVQVDYKEELSEDQIIKIIAKYTKQLNIYLDLCSIFFALVKTINLFNYYIIFLLYN